MDACFGIDGVAAGDREVITICFQPVEGLGSRRGEVDDFLVGVKFRAGVVS